MMHYQEKNNEKNEVIITKVYFVGILENSWRKFCELAFGLHVKLKEKFMLKGNPSERKLKQKLTS